MSKTVILGHSGFIGSRLLARMQLEFGVESVVGFSSSDFNLTDKDSVDRLGSLLNNGDSLFLCSMIKREYGDHLENFYNNLAITETVAKVIRERPDIHLYYLSSTAVYGEEVHNRSIDENTAVSPTSYYGIAKYASEKLFERLYVSKGGIGLAILRPSVIYGPEEKHRVYNPAGFADSAMKGETIQLWGDGSELRDFLYIDDLIEIVVRLYGCQFSGVINIASGISRSFSDVIEILAKLMKRELVTSTRARSKEKVDHGFKISALQKQLPGFQFISVEKGLEKVLGTEKQG